MKNLQMQLAAAPASPRVRAKQTGFVRVVRGEKTDVDKLIGEVLSR